MKRYFSPTSEIKFSGLADKELGGKISREDKKSEHNPPKLARMVDKNARHAFGVAVNARRFVDNLAATGVWVLLVANFFRHGGSYWLEFSTVFSGFSAAKGVWILLVANLGKMFLRVDDCS